MYCPMCGYENSDDSQFCASCSENLEKEIGFKNKKKKLNSLVLLFFAILMIGIFLGSWQAASLGGILFIISLIGYPLLPRLSDHHSKIYCPRCEESEFNEKFCVKCGYNLDDVLGYLKTDKHDIEMNKNFIKIYEKTRVQNGIADRPGRHSHRRSKPETLILDKISDFRLSKCKSTFSHYPCILFNYKDEKCHFYLSKKEDDKCTFKVSINSKVEMELQKILATGYFDKIQFQDESSGI